MVSSADGVVTAGIIIDISVCVMVSVAILAVATFASGVESVPGCAKVITLLASADAVAVGKSAAPAEGRGACAIDGAAGGAKFSTDCVAAAIDNCGALALVGMLVFTLRLRGVMTSLVKTTTSIITAIDVASRKAGYQAKIDLAGLRSIDLGSTNERGALTAGRDWVALIIDRVWAKTARQF